jgi:hypothetical protein
MIRAAVALSVLWATAGCVTTGAAPADTDSFRGQRSEPILAKLGPPESAEKVGSGTVYRWRTFTRLENVPVRGTRTSYESGLPVTVPTMTVEQQTQPCTLVLTVDGGGTVTDFSRTGSRQACAPLLDRL